METTTKCQKLENIMWDSCPGQYDYKLDNTYYQLFKYGTGWVVYETEEYTNYNGQITPHDWMVVDSCATLKEAKESLVSYLSSEYK